MIIGETQFRIPYTHCFNMNVCDGVQMLLGCNFIRAQHGGVRIEGNRVTFYRNTSHIETITESEFFRKLNAEMMEELFLSQEIVCFNVEEKFGKQFPDVEKILNRLEGLEYIGKNPQKHWLKNQVICKIDIINPDITIQDKPLKHVTPAMQDSYRKHVKALLEIGVIRPSQSRHRTIAILVNLGSTIDPVTKKVIHGKERLVFDYRKVNNNTHKDQYSLPGINTLIKRIGNSKIYSKFDLKSGFHQIAMDPDSIPWTSFIVPNGLYEWLVMPFGLKNAPTIFQRKMDDCFKGTEEFIIAYIDDILIYSSNLQEHRNHLDIFFKICQERRLVLSKEKMIIGVQEIQFLGAVIGNRKLKHQPHIIKKIIEFNEDELKKRRV